MGGLLVKFAEVSDRQFFFCLGGIVRLPSRKPLLTAMQNYGDSTHALER